MSKEQQAQEQPQVAIPLPKAKKNLVQIGCICMMLSVAMYGLVFATLTAPILEKVDAMGYVGLFSIVGEMCIRDRSKDRRSGWNRTLSEDSSS